MRSLYVSFRVGPGLQSWYSWTYIPLYKECMYISDDLIPWCSFRLYKSFCVWSIHGQARHGFHAICSWSMVSWFWGKVIDGKNDHMQNARLCSNPLQSICPPRSLQDFSILPTAMRARCRECVEIFGWRHRRGGPCLKTQLQSRPAGHCIRSHILCYTVYNQLKWWIYNDSTAAPEHL